jgi:phosphate-selective porin OprO/OprP
MDLNIEGTMKTTPITMLAIAALIAAFCHHANGQDPLIYATDSSAISPVEENTSPLNLEAKLADLQKEIDALKKATEKANATQDKEIEKVADKIPPLVIMGHGNGSMKLSGRVHADYWAFPKVNPGIFPLEATADNPGGDPQDRTGFRRLRFGVSGKVKDNMVYKIEMEFAGGNNVEFRDAYLGWNDLPFFRTLLIGNQKRPLGLDHLNSSRYNVFMERPFVIESFNQDARRFGIESYGYSKDERWNWRYGVFNMELTQATGNYVGDHYQLDAAGRLANTAWYDESSNGRGYAHFAISGSMRFPDGLGPNNQSRYRHRPEARSSNRWLDTGQIAGADQENIIGLETAINFGALQFVGEYMFSDISRQPGFGPDVHLHGGYFYLSYFLTGEHMPWDRKTGTLARIKPFENFFSVRDCEGCVRRGLGAWQVAARYSSADFTNENIVGGETDALTLGLNWYWNPYARWQFNYIIGDIDRQAAGGGDYQIIGMRFMIDF